MSDKSILGFPLGETKCSFLIGGIMGLFDESERKCDSSAGG